MTSTDVSSGHVGGLYDISTIIEHFRNKSFLQKQENELSQ